MSNYNPYANLNQQPNGGAQPPPQQVYGQQHIPNGTQGYQQGPPYGQEAHNRQQTPLGGPQQSPYGPSGQQQPLGYPPIVGQQAQSGIGDSGSVGGLTSQLGGMGLGQEPAGNRPSKKKNRHAYHNLDQQTVSTQAFNQSMGNAPQYVNQEETQTVQPYNSQYGAQPGPAPFSPGLSTPGTPGILGPIQPPPASVSQQVSAQGRVDPEQIPSVARARDGAERFYLDHVYPTMEQHLPPQGGVPFVAHDQGNTSPKFARLTLNNIPSSSDALSSTGLPLGLIVQPLAPLQAGESTIPVLDFGDVGPPRCRRCRAYINPFMVFRNGGNKLVCNMCTFPNDVTPDYFAPTDPTGVRVDRNQRPELTTGTVEYLVPKEYWAKEPVGLRWLFVMDVSQDANDKDFLAAFCAGVLEALYGEDPDAEAEEKDDVNENNESRPLPIGTKVGFVTFDKVVQFYNCHVSSTCHALPQYF